MKRFEYKRAELSYAEMETAEKVDAWRQQYMEWLNAFGADGWEIIKFDFGPNACVTLLKREVE